MVFLLVGFLKDKQPRSESFPKGVTKPMSVNDRKEVSREEEVPEKAKKVCG